MPIHRPFEGTPGRPEAKATHAGPLPPPSHRGHDPALPPPSTSRTRPRAGGGGARTHLRARLIVPVPLPVPVLPPGPSGRLCPRPSARPRRPTPPQPRPLPVPRLIGRGWASSRLPAPDALLLAGVLPLRGGRGGPCRWRSCRGGRAGREGFPEGRCSLVLHVDVQAPSARKEI